MIQALSLLTMAIHLLIAVNNPAVPLSLKQQAISVANLAIQVSNQVLKESTSVKSSPPIPVIVLNPPPPPVLLPPATSSPHQPPPPPSFQILDIPQIIFPNLVSEPILEFTNHIVSRLEFTANKEVRCDVSIWSNHCILGGYNKVSELFVDCLYPVADKYPFVYVFAEGKEYTCKILLTDKNGNDTRAKFNFIAK